MLLASATTLPLLLAAAGCRSSDAFAGPDPLAGRPRLAPDVVTLQAVITAEENLIFLYRTAISGDSRTARSQRAQAAAHPARTAPHPAEARLIQPAGTASAQASRSATGPAPGRVTIARLRTAERASATSLVRRLAMVEPALAQLFASIAAADATHVTALGG